MISSTKYSVQFNVKYSVTETSSAKYSVQFSFMPSPSLFTSLSHLKLGAKWFKLSEISIAARFMDNSMNWTSFVLQGQIHRKR